MSRLAQLKQTLGKNASEPEIRNPDDDDDLDDDELPETKPKEAEMADNVEVNAAVEAARKEGHTAGFKEANDRMNAVFASEHYAGREAAATKLLSKNMSAEDIVDVLADMPKAEANAALSDEQRKAAEEAGRKEMKDAMSETQNSNIEANGGGGKTKTDSRAVWAKAKAKVFPNSKAQ
ncbi:hypothetical protein [Caenibius sp. WL]|uniref:hypothetical protein n=1 Tax=Caenibius sp. WL TaxID=2872646 RepID=UPI001C99416F|nr:hypothetical protein [Caenibius sp. WL]QZP06804.1 hypothetical protein K5X80_08690 [Caenibius sp. WL]